MSQRSLFGVPECLWLFRRRTQGIHDVCRLVVGESSERLSSNVWFHHSSVKVGARPVSAAFMFAAMTSGAEEDDREPPEPNDPPSIGAH